MSTKETRKNIIQAGRKAVDELIKVAEEKIITDSKSMRLRIYATKAAFCLSYTK